MSQMCKYGKQYWKTILKSQKRENFLFYNEALAFTRLAKSNPTLNE